MPLARLSKTAILLILKTFIVATIILSCEHIPTAPAWDGKVYRFSLTDAAIYRKIDGEVLDYISLPKEFMNKWSAISDQDLKKLFKIINMCQAWPEDVTYYKKKLKSCGIYNEENIKEVSSCLEP